MSILASLEPARRVAAPAALLLAALVLACTDAGGDGAGAGSNERGVAVDPCALLTKEEIAEELLQAVSPSQRAAWSTPEFTVSGTVANRGESSACEYAFESRQAVGGTAASRGEFNVMVSPADLVLVPGNERLPVPQAGPEMFRAAASEGVYYVLKGGHAATIGNFPGRTEGGADAGRIALLGRIAERLP